MANTGSATLTLQYGVGPEVAGPGAGPNVAGNLGLVWCFCNNGNLPSSVTDTNGNSWCPLMSFSTNVGCVGVFYCMTLNGGANTVTAVFACSPVDGTPSMHIAEYSYLYPAQVAALQPSHQHNPFITYSWGIAGSYTWGSSGFPLTSYFNAYSGGSQETLTVTAFLALYDIASNHGWGAGGNGTPRAQTEELGGSGASTVSGDYTFTLSSGTRTFAPSFSLIYAPGPQTQPENYWLGFLVIEATP